MDSAKGGAVHFKEGVPEVPDTQCTYLCNICLFSAGGYASEPARLSPVVRVRYSPAHLRLTFPPLTVPLW